MARKIDILKEDKNTILSLFEGLLRSNAQELLDEAAKATKEKLEKLIGDMSSAHNPKSSRGVAGAQVKTDREEKRVKALLHSYSLTTYSVYVDDNTQAGKVFNILDQGERVAKGPAVKYGIKAWPMYTPRQSPNSHMTAPNSIRVKTPTLVEDLIFRPVIYNPIAARNFMKIIKDEIEKEFPEVKLLLQDK